MPDTNALPAMNFEDGVPVAEIPDGKMLSGTLNGNELLLVNSNGEFFAIGAHCTHYGGPLSEGLIVDGTVRCPLHHACFSLRTGEALRAPALDPVPCWKTEKVGEKVFIREQLSPGGATRAAGATRPQGVPESVVILGGGAAGLAAADMLRREGYAGAVTIISADDSPPVDRPNLSKDFLAGTASEEWIPLRPPDYYAERNIELVLNAPVTALDPKAKQVQLENGKIYRFGALLLATGADPVRLDIEGAADSRVHYLRTYRDSLAIVAKAAAAKRVVVVGASFIGLEVAASLRMRKIEVHVVAPGSQPLERVLGTELGAAIRKLHESQGVVFHLGVTVSRIDERSVTLSDNTKLDADFVVVGVGVRPTVALAEQAGLEIDRGVAVNEYLETSVPGIFAAGDIARWPDPHSATRIRVEHWVVAERQGQVAAMNILGKRIKFDAVPFFWSQHYETKINYTGYAERWDTVQIDGSLEDFHCSVTYKLEDKTLAVATISRELESLQAEASFESTYR
jgi:apoptosis-inducing factor 3